MNFSDDKELVISRRDLSGGVNTRQHARNIAETQVSVLYNGDISIAGQTSKRYGSTLIGDDISNITPAYLHNYTRQGYTDALVQYNFDDMLEWIGVGNFSSVSAATFSSGHSDVGIISAKESGLTPDDIIIVQNGTDNAKRFHKDSTETWAVQDLGSTSGTGSDSPPKSTVMAWYANRVWVLLNDLLYFSDAYDSDYSTAFDTGSQAFRVPVGAERKIIPTRDTGLVVMGEKAIWGLAPSLVPDPTADKPQPLVLNYGVVSKKGAVSSGDDIYFFSQDGFRSLKRTVQDKLQLGVSYPISYSLKDEFDNIAWGYISQLSMEVFDNKIFIAVPTAASTYDTWIYYPVSNSFTIIQGWSPACWSIFKVGGVEELFYGKHGNGVVYRAWYGFSDEGTTTTNGTAINYQEEGRKEDMGQALLKKSGGEVEIKAVTAGNFDVSIYASFDEGGWNTLGTLNLSGNAPSLPVTLPFTLANANVVSAKYHIDTYGEWGTIQLKIQHNDTNGSADIIILERNIVTYLVPYYSE